MSSGGHNGIECAVIIKRDGCLLVVHVTEEANRKEISSRLERREAQLGAAIIAGNSPSGHQRLPQIQQAARFCRDSNNLISP